VVKIDMKKLIFGILFLMIAVPIVHAGTGKLLIDRVDVKVDDRWDRNVKEGDTISREAEPGSTVDFKIKFRNNYTDEENLRIEDVTATVTIEGIDDGEDIDEESNEFSIREDDDKTVTVKFEIPIEVEEDTYTVTIEAEGEDENGTEQSVVMSLELEVKKEDHELRIYRKTLSPSEVKCGGTATLNLGIINTGNEDEEDVELTISNTGLEYSNVATISEIIAEPYADESKYLKTFRIEVPEDAEVGLYPLILSITYGNGDKTLEDSVDLVVSECEVEEAPPAPQEEEEEVVVVEQPTAPTAAVVTEPTITEPITSTEETSFFQSGTFIALLLGAELVIIVIVVLMVMLILRKRRE
jgi:hypothetical protein